MKILLALLLASPASAYTLEYDSDVKDVTAMVARIEAATGLNFQGKCSHWTPLAPPRVGYSCDSWLPINGRVMTADDYTVIVEVFDSPQPDDPRVAPLQLTPEQRAALNAQIDGAVPEPAP